jgi:hypothetical protein
MRNWAAWTAVLLVCLCAPVGVRADDSAWKSSDAVLPAAAPLSTQPDYSAVDTSSLAALQPKQLDQLSGDETVFGPPPAGPHGEPGNNGDVNLDIYATYATDYVYRGVNHDDVGATGNSLNLLIGGRLTFDFGDYPHLFVGLFSNIYDADPVSRFQEIRPSVGATWNLRPFLLEFGNNSYIYPQREDFNTSELYGQVTIDDSLLFNTDGPVLSPYAMAAWNVDSGKGWYVEMGLSHNFVIEDWGLTLTVKACAAYIARLQQEFIFINTVQDTGWQHAEGGIYGTYSLNTLLNIPRRYGEFDLTGFIDYSGKLSKQITASNVLWGGGGIGFKY